jgi:hypothetical protein
MTPGCIKLSVIQKASKTPECELYDVYFFGNFAQDAGVADDGRAPFIPDRMEALLALCRFKPNNAAFKDIQS